MSAPTLPLPPPGRGQPVNADDGGSRPGGKNVGVARPCGVSQVRNLCAGQAASLGGASAPSVRRPMRSKQPVEHCRISRSVVPTRLAARPSAVRSSRPCWRIRHGAIRLLVGLQHLIAGGPNTKNPHAVVRGSCRHRDVLVDSVSCFRRIRRISSRASQRLRGRRPRRSNSLRQWRRTFAARIAEFRTATELGELSRDVLRLQASAGTNRHRPPLARAPGAGGCVVVAAPAGRSATSRRATSNAA